MPKDSSYKFVKANSNGSYYEFLRYMDSGSSRPFLVKKKDKDTYYVLKKPFESAQSIYKEIIQEEFSEQEREEELRLVHSLSLRERSFYEEKDRFSIEFIRLISPDLAPKSKIFFNHKAISQKHPPINAYLGTKFLNDYHDWVEFFDFYQHETLKFYNHSDKKKKYTLDKEGYLLVTNQQGITKSIFGIGYCAIIALILMISDMHPKNWGLRDTRHYYMAILLDSGLSFDSQQASIQISNICDAHDVLWYAFGKYNIPASFFKSLILHREIYKAIAFIKELLDAGKFALLINNFFNDFVSFRKPIFNRIENNINLLFENTASAREKMSIEYSSLPTYPVGNENSNEMDIDYELEGYISDSELISDNDEEEDLDAYMSRQSEYLRERKKSF